MLLFYLLWTNDPKRFLTNECWDLHSSVGHKHNNPNIAISVSIVQSDWNRYSNHILKSVKPLEFFRDRKRHRWRVLLARHWNSRNKKGKLLKALSAASMPRYVESSHTFQTARKRAFKENGANVSNTNQLVSYRKPVSCRTQDPAVMPWTKRPEAAIWTIGVSWEIPQDVISVAA